MKFRHGNVTRQVTLAAVGVGVGAEGHPYNEVAAAQGLVGLSEQPKSGYIRNLRKRPGDIIEQPENEVHLDDLGEGQEVSKNVSPKQNEICPKKQKLEVVEAESVEQESPQEASITEQVSELIEG